MLSLTVHGPESFNEKTEKFERPELFRIELEHSLASLSKWESHFERPFLGPTEKTTEETLWYITAMVVGGNAPEDFLESLQNEHIEAINDYINSKMTATWFSEVPNAPARRETITAEIVYHWMIDAGIPFECQYWHLNKLITLIRVRQEKNAPPKKMSQQEAIAKQRELNAKRKQMYNTSG